MPIADPTDPQFESNKDGSVIAGKDTHDDAVVVLTAEAYETVTEAIKSAPMPSAWMRASAQAFLSQEANS